MPVSLSLSDALGHALTDKRIDILRHIGACGSISQAARAVGVSYKAAWQALDTLTNLAGSPLVSRAVGGAGGGGAQLTDAGRELLAAADAMTQARGAVLSRWQASPHAGPALGRLAVRTSMRNQLPAVVLRLQALGQIVQVHLQLGLGNEAAQAGAAAGLSSRITRESAELLGLQPGLPVQVLCKATAVRVERRGAKAGSAGRLPPARQGCACGAGRVGRRSVGGAGRRAVHGGVCDARQWPAGGQPGGPGARRKRGGVGAGGSLTVASNEEGVAWRDWAGPAGVGHQPSAH